MYIQKEDRLHLRGTLFDLLSILRTISARHFRKTLQPAETAALEMLQIVGYRSALRKEVH